MCAQPAYWILAEDGTMARIVHHFLAGFGEVYSGDLSMTAFTDAPSPDLVVWLASEPSENSLERGLALLARVPQHRRPSPPLLFVSQEGARPHEAELRPCIDDRAFEVLEWPLDAEDFAIGFERVLARGPRPPTLRERAQRSWVTQAVERLYSGIDLPALRHAIDPRNAARPVLLLGEPGTRRGLLARYVHDFAEPARGAMLGISLESLEPGHVEREILRRTTGDRTTVYLQHFDRASRPLQIELAHVFEASGLLGIEGLRFIASATRMRSVAPALRELPWMRVSLPPLRERSDLAELARAVLDARARAVGRRAELTPEAAARLADHTWPGNLRELDATLDRALQTSSGAVIGVDHLEVGIPYGPLARAVPLARAAPAEPSVELRAVRDLPGEVEEPALAPAGIEAPVEPEGADPRPVEPLVEAELEGRPEPLVEAELEGTDEPEPEAEPHATDSPGALPGTPAVADPPVSPLIAPLGDAIRQPLLALRTSAQLLRQRPEDAGTRRELNQHVDRDLARIEGVLSVVERFSGLKAPKLEPVDVAGLLGEALERILPRVRERSIVLLRELDDTAPPATADSGQLRFVIDGLLDCALRMLPPGGDLYVGSRHQPGGERSAPGHRLLIRFHSPEDVLSTPTGVPGPEEPVEIVIARHLVERMGGVFAVDTGGRQDNVVLIELRGQLG